MLSPHEAHRKTRQVVNFLDDLSDRQPGIAEEIQLDRSIFLARLENKEIITPPLLSKIGFRFDLPREERKELLGITNVFEGHERLEQMLADGSDAAHTSEWTFRIAAANQDLCAEGWYPFMITLTLDQARFPDGEAFWSGRHWERYVRKLVEVSGSQLGVGSREARSRPTDFVRYCGVIEHGKSREHHHSHVMVWMRAIPESWKVDPNAGQAVPNRLECTALNSFWNFGFAQSKYFRFVGDPWTDLGFVVPLNEDGLPFVLGPVESAGRYVMKYMRKETKEWRHRIRATSSLGMSRLKELLTTLTMEELVQVIRPIQHFMTHMKLQSHTSIPVRLVRRLAKRQRICLEWLNDPTGWTSRRRPSFCEMLKSVRAGLEPWQMCSKERYEWQQQCAGPPETAFCEDVFFDAWEKVCLAFPARDNKQTRAIGGV